MPGDVLGSLLPLLEARFPGRIARLGPGLSQPEYALSQERQQYLAKPVLMRLKGLRDEAERVLGIVDLDLFGPGLTFLTAEAEEGGGVALIATYRLRGESSDGDVQGLPVQRVLKQAVHELGHTYGMEHCPDTTCVMFSGDDLTQLDVKSSEFCPRHLGTLERVLPAA